MRSRSRQLSREKRQALLRYRKPAPVLDNLAAGANPISRNDLDLVFSNGKVVGGQDARQSQTLSRITHTRPVFLLAKELLAVFANYILDIDCRTQCSLIDLGVVDLQINADRLATLVDARKIGNDL